MASTDDRHHAAALGDPDQTVADDASASTAASSPWTTFMVVCGAIVAGTLNFSIAFVAYPELRRTFDASASSISWSVTAFSITAAALTMPAGWLADRLGRRRQFLFGVAVLALGSALVAVSPNLGWLIAARVVQATGMALEVPAAQALVLAAFPVERRSTAVGAIGACGGVFSALGPIVGGALIDSVGWRWTFAANIPVALATIAVSARYLPRDAPLKRTAIRDSDGTSAVPRPDLIGTVLLVIGISLVALGIVEADRWGWASGRTLGSIAVGAALLVALVRRSRHHPDPVIDLGLWRFRNFRVGTVLIFVVAGHFGPVFLMSMIMLTDGWGLTRVHAGLAVAMIPAIGGPVTFIVGRWADRYGHARVIMPGGLLFVAAGIFLSTQIGDERQLLAVWFPGVVMYGLAVGLSHSASHASALSEIPPDRLGRAGGTAKIFMDLGSTVWVAIAVAILAGADDTIAGVRIVFATMVIVGLASLPLAAALRRIQHPR